MTATVGDKAKSEVQKVTTKDKDGNEKTVYKYNGTEYASEQDAKNAQKLAEQQVKDDEAAAAAKAKKDEEINQLSSSMTDTDKFGFAGDVIKTGIVGSQWIGGARENLDLSFTGGETTGNFTSDPNSDKKHTVDGKETKATSTSNPNGETKAETEDVSNISTLENEAFQLVFGMPNWGVENYLKERDSWQKQLDTITGEPGWFYFKIFFKFNTGFGLLGDIIGEVSYHNSALMYLASVYRPAYALEMIATRARYLQRFVRTLNFISTKAPWFFKGVKGLDKCGNAYINDFGKEKSIEIECSEEAVDMRLTTLLDMYKFCAFDEINCKEIIPENLRKFDMSIVLFHVPIRWWQTRSKIHGKSYNPKSFNPKAEQDTLSYKMYTFLNCEIDPASLGIITPNSINNEQPFQLGKSSIKINYDRCYTHIANEWSQDMFGADGARNIGDLANTDRRRSIKSAYETFMSFGENQSNITENAELIDVTENLISTLFDGEDFGIGDGNVYYIGEQGYSGYIGPKSTHDEENAPQHEESDYWAEKMKLVKGRATKNTNIGNVYNYEVGPGTVYFENKMKNLKGHGNQLSLYQYLIGPKCPSLNRKESEYFKRKMEILHHGGNVDRPGTTFGLITPERHGYTTPYQDKYNQWLLNYKYNNTLKKTATYNPYGYVGKSNKMSTTVPKTYVGKATRNFLTNLFNSIKPKFLR